jgi:hypothetical protein
VTVFDTMLDATHYQQLVKHWVFEGNNFPVPLYKEPQVLSIIPKDTKPRVVLANFVKEESWSLFGKPELAEPRFGDCVLSVMLSVASAKLSTHSETINLGLLENITDSNPVSNSCMHGIAIRLIHVAVKGG